MLNFFKTNKTKLIIILAVIITLTVTFFIGGDNSSSEKENSNIVSETSQKVSVVINEETSDLEESYISKSESSTVLHIESSCDDFYIEEKSVIAESNNISIVSEDEQEKESEVSLNSIIDIQESSKNDNKSNCTISICCDTILDNIDKLDKSKKNVVPSDGIILNEICVEYSEGESVFDILKKVCIDKGIHLEFSKTPAYNTVYIEGINNIYEFDCGAASGWTYRVNGKSCSYSCSEYILNEGDKIEWFYTCNMGKDLS